MKVYKFISLMFIAFVLVTAYGCKKEPDPITDPGGGDPVIPPPTNTDEVPTIIPTGEEAYLNLNSDYIFDQNKLGTYELIIPPESLEFLDNDPAAEIYVEGSLVFEGDTLSPIGVRYKGSIGAFVNCVSGNNWADPSGEKICTKLSMKIKVNWQDSPYRFYGLNKIQLHSMNFDDSQMRDRLGYWLFREMGVPAPRAVHAKLKVNGEYVGLFALIEQIDGRFAKYHFEDGDGNLYKEVWPLDSNGNPFSEDKYLQHLKTNEDENPSATIIKSFAESIATANDANIKSRIESGMDIQEVLSYAVVDRAIRHDDGPFHWYCNFGNCSPHNFYWLETPEDEKLHIVAWDLDLAFENITSTNPVTNIPDGWGETRNDCQPFTSGFFGLQQRSAACDKLIGGWAKYESEYEAIKTDLINGPLSISSANLMLDMWASQVREATIEARELHDDAISLGQWNFAIEELKDQLEIARN